MFTPADVGQMTDTLLRTTPNYCPAISLDFLEPSAESGVLGRLGQYEIIEVIGRGGMGIAPESSRYSARSSGCREGARAPSWRPIQRRTGGLFVKPGGAAAVSHDHVVTVHAVEPGDLPYLAMEYIDGYSLQQKIDREGPLECQEDPAYRDADCLWLGRGSLPRFDPPRHQACQHPAAKRHRASANHRLWLGSSGRRCDDHTHR